MFWMSEVDLRPPVGVFSGATIRNNDRRDRLCSFIEEEGDLLKIIVENVLKFFEDPRPLF